MADLDIASLGEDLAPPARRRLWLLGQVMQRCSTTDLDAALARVATLEAFIAGRSGKYTAALPDENRIADAACANVPPPNGSAASTVVRLEALGGPRKHAAERSQAQTPLLDGEIRARFIAEAARDPDNRRLAALFGFTVRQAHAIRVAFRRQIVAAGGRAGNNGERPPRVERLASVPRARPSARPKKRGKVGIELDRETEIRMQEEFLARKPPPTHTVEDVVRFLRQQGDVILPDGSGYRVNFAQILTQEQLIARGNERRSRKGLAPFMMPHASPRPDVSVGATETAA